MNLSEHFSLHEATFSLTATRFKIDNTPSLGTISIMTKAANKMESVRRLLGKPIRVASWYRSIPLNRKIGSSDNSAHTDGWAIDFTCAGFGTPKQICQAIIDAKIDFDQLIYEGTWVHISFAPLMRGEVLTAIFTKRKTKYIKGLA